MKRGILSFLLIFIFQISWADLAIIGYNADGDNDLVFVVTNPAGIPSGTTIFFTDNEYFNGTNSFNTSGGDGVLQLVTTVALPAGTIINLQQPGPSAINTNGGGSVGVVTEPDTPFNIAGGMDAVYAYTTVDNTHIGVVNNIFSSFTDNGYDNSSEDPSATYPNAIVTNLALAGSDGDNAVYDPANGTCFATLADFIAAIQNAANYTVTDGVGDQSIDISAAYFGIGFKLAPVNAVPTLSEWGLIFLSLLILTIGIIYSNAQEMAIAGTGKNISIYESIRRPPFYSDLFAKSLLWLSILAGVIGIATFAIFGEITVVDFLGSIVVLPLLAYLIHLLEIDKFER